MKTYTIEEIRQALNIPEQIKAAGESADIFRESMDGNGAFDLMEAITNNIKKNCAANPQTAADVDSWTLLDKLTWYCRESYVVGMIEGYRIACTMIHNALRDLEDQA